MIGDVALLLTGAGVFAAGLGIGYLIRPRRTPAGPPLVCSCGHTPGAHDSQQGVCGADVSRPHYLPTGTRNGSEWAMCACATYDGPEPLPAFTPRGLTLPPG